MHVRFTVPPNGAFIVLRFDISITFQIEFSFCFGIAPDRTYSKNLQ